MNDRVGSQILRPISTQSPYSTGEPRYRLRLSPIVLFKGILNLYQFLLLYIRSGIEVCIIQSSFMLVAIGNAPVHIIGLHTRLS